MCVPRWTTDRVTSVIDIKTVTRDDVETLQSVLDTIELFPSEMLPDMLGAHFDGGEEAIWLKAERDDQVIGFCYATPEAMTDGTWNMLALGVCADAQRSGAGAAIVRGLERTLRNHGGRLLIVDTSGDGAYANARAFYQSQGYAHVATIPDYWAKGDDKVTFAKSLTT